MSFSAVAVVATLSHCSTPPHSLSLSLPPQKLSRRSHTLSHTHTRSLALFRTSLLSFYLCHSCFGALILTAVDMHIMGIERFLFFSSFSFLFLSPFLPLCLPSWLSRDWFSSWVSPVFCVFFHFFFCTIFYCI